MLTVSNAPDCALAANACVAVCTLLVLGVAFTCCVRCPFWFGGSDLSVTGERSSCYGIAFFLLRESVLLVTGERSSCYGRAFFLLREADFSVGRIDFSTSRKCFSAFAQVHLSPLTSVFMYSCRWFSVLLQAHHVLCMSSWRVCKQGFSPAPPCPVVAPCGDAVRCQKNRYRNLYLRISIPLIERFCCICWL